jgi:hypothetical protein
MDTKTKRRKEGYERMLKKTQPYTIVTVALVIAFATGYYVLSQRQPAGNVKVQLDAVERALIEAFKQQFLMPIVLAADQTPGDVMDWSSWTLDERSMQCFPTLQLPPPKPTTLPAVTTLESLNGGLSLGLNRTFRVDGRDARTFRLSIQFEDAQIVLATKGDLRRALSDQCAHLEPVVTEKPWMQTAPPPLIIGRVVSARKRVVLVVDNDSDLEIAARVATSAAAGKTKVTRADSQALLAFGLAGHGGVVLESNERLPVAFAPAFLFGKFPTERGADDLIFQARELNTEDSVHEGLFEAALKARLDALR